MLVEILFNALWSFPYFNDKSINMNWMINFYCIWFKFYHLLNGRTIMSQMWRDQGDL